MVENLENSNEKKVLDIDFANDELEISKNMRSVEGPSLLGDNNL